MSLRCRPTDRPTGVNRQGLLAPERGLRSSLPPSLPSLKALPGIKTEWATTDGPLRVEGVFLGLLIREN